VLDRRDRDRGAGAERHLPLRMLDEAHRAPQRPSAHPTDGVRGASMGCAVAWGAARRRLPEDLVRSVLAPSLLMAAV